MVRHGRNKREIRIKITKKLLAENVNKTKEYHWNLKQYCGVKACMARAEKSHSAHIQLAIKAFIRMEWSKFVKDISLIEQEMSSGRRAV